jgi:diguanylate cyclase (GGDEF)-like protein/PAS domain S-box-containing protein
MTNIDNKTAIKAEQIRHMFVTSNITQITSVVLALTLAFMLRKVDDPEMLLGWLALIILIALGRTALAVGFQRAVVADDKAANFWLNSFRLGVFLSGIVWGAASLLLFPTYHLQYQVFIIAVLCGLSAGGLVSYSVDLPSGILYITAVLAPLIIRLFFEPHDLSASMGAAMLLYLWFMLMSLKHMNRSVAENITLRIEAAEREQAVKVSEQRYRLLLSHSPAGIFHYDSNFVITYCNSRFAEILKTTADHVTGLDMKILKDQSIMPALINAIAGKLGHYEGQYSATLTDASGWIAMSCAPALDGEGKVSGGVAIVQDITQRKLAEDTLRESENRFRFMLENSPIAVRITKVKSGLVVFANQSYAELLNIGPDEVIGIDPSGYYPQQKEYDNVLKKLRNGERVTNELVELKIKDGQTNSKWTLASYLLLDFENEPAVLGWFYDISDRKQMEVQVQRLAHFDSLTDLPNRTLFKDRLHQALSSAKRDKLKLAIMFIDLDKFKPINDTQGHHVGDLVLKQVAERIQGCLRESDTVARIGGDEFVVLLPTIEADMDVINVAEKIRSVLNKPFEISGESLQISSSTGISLFPEHGEDENGLIKNADIAMYHAKAEGRNKVKIFNFEM